MSIGMDGNEINIAGIGASLIDTLMKTDYYPVEDTKQPASMSVMQGGGPVATALVAAQKLGANTAYIGYTGTDIFADMIRNELRQYGVNVSFMHVQEQTVSPHSFIILSQNTGSRTCIYNMGTLEDNGLQNEDFELLSRVNILHIDGHYLKSTMQGVQFAKEHGVLVSYDAGGIYPEIDKLLPYVDILIPSEEFSIRFTACSSAEEAIKVLHERYNPKVLVITQGKRGGIYWDHGDVKHYYSYPVNVVDSNGAGDVFHGAFLKGYLDGMNIQQCCQFASAASALKCTGFGARRSSPDYRTVTNFMNIYE